MTLENADTLGGLADKLGDLTSSQYVTLSMPLQSQQLAISDDNMLDQEPAASDITLSAPSTFDSFVSSQPFEVPAAEPTLAEEFTDSSSTEPIVTKVCNIL